MWMTIQPRSKLIVSSSHLLKMRFNLCLIVLVINLIVHSNAIITKTLYYSEPQFIDSVICVSINYFFSFYDTQNHGYLSIVVREVNNYEQPKEIDKIPLTKEFALDWNLHSRTIYFDHSGSYVISVIHNQPTDFHSTAVMINVKLEEKKCRIEAPFEYPTEPPSTIEIVTTTQLPVTEFKFETTTESSMKGYVATSTIYHTTNQPTTIVTTPIPTEKTAISTSTNNPQSKEKTSTLDTTITEKSIISTQSFDISTTKGVPIVTQSPVITSTLNYDDETKLVKQSDAITIDSAYDDQKTRLDASVTPTSPVTTENSYTTIEVPTIVTQSSTTIDSIVTMSSTVNHENHSTQSETTTIDTNSQYVDQMSTKSTTNESTDSTKSTTNESTDSTKSTTTIKIVLIDAIQPEPTASDSNNEPDAKTGSIEDDLIFKIKFLTNKRNAIASVTGLVGLFIMMASLTFLISRLKRQNYQPRNRDLIVSSSSNGIALHTITINRQSTA